MTARKPAKKPTRKAAPKARTVKSHPGLPSDLSADLAGFAITPLRFLMGVVNDAQAPQPDRIRCAVAAAQYLHNRLRDGAKGEQREAAAKAAHRRGRFVPMNDERGDDE